MILLSQVQKRYGARVVLDIPLLEVVQGERIAIIGANGSGKSTLLRLIAGVIQPETGKIETLASARGEIGYLPQQPFAFDLSVEQNVALALEATPERRQSVRHALDRVGLLHLAKSRANKLSGGETQRMALARILATKRNILLLDEPTASADIGAIELIERAISDYADETGCTILFTSHAPSQAMRLSTRVIALDGGVICESGETAQVLHAPLDHRTRDFLKSWRI